MGFNVNLKADATDALTEITTALSKGCAKVVNLFFGKNEANVERHKALVSAQTRRDCEQVLSGELDYVEGKLVKSVPRTCFADRICQVEQQEERKNLAGNTAIALDVLKSTPNEDISDEDVNPDWFARWRREAKVIGDRDLQLIWGKILAEEIKNPNTISFRALDTLKNLTKNEAEIFQEISTYVTENRFLLKAYFEGKFCDESEAITRLIVLEECNLITSINSNLTLTSQHETGILLFREYAIVPKNSDHKLRVEVIALTPVGKELFKLIDVPDFPDEHLSTLEKDVFYEGNNSLVKVEVDVKKAAGVLWDEKQGVL